MLEGEKTVEGHISGKGKLSIIRPDGSKSELLTSESPLVAVVNVGELMQWEVDPDSDLVAFEICYPPYEDGRFENIK